MIFQILFILSSLFHVVNFSVPIISGRGRDKIGAGGGKWGLGMQLSPWEIPLFPDFLHELWWQMFLGWSRAGSGSCGQDQEGSAGNSPVLPGPHWSHSPALFCKD